MSAFEEVPLICPRVAKPIPFISLPVLVHELIIEYIGGSVMMFQKPTEQV